MLLRLLLEGSCVFVCGVSVIENLLGDFSFFLVSPDLLFLKHVFYRWLNVFLEKILSGLKEVISHRQFQLLLRKFGHYI